jgi:cobyrinic acid a,c-diamide synthase
MADARPSVPRLIVGGVASGVGKTTMTIALARALASRGLRVALFKCGPDYLDPTYHARAAGRPSHNLDGWMMGRDAVLATFERGARDADLALVEGVMGLFDGASPTSDHGSTAEIARWLDAPVLAVIDASAMARTVAAVAYGLAAFDPVVRVAGTLCNRVGSRGHLDLLRAATSAPPTPGCPAGAPPVVGGLPDLAELGFPERHLGLHTADERAVPDRVLEGWGQVAAEWITLDAVLAIARSARELPAPSAATPVVGPGPVRRCTIAVAHDEAFHFYYEDNLRRLEELGATLVRFSPLRDAGLPDAAGVYLGGGYPEVHAEALAANEPMRASLRAFAARGGPVYAECGGLMYLTRAIRTLDGRAHPMVGLISGEAAMRDRLQAIGYVEVETQRPTLLGPAGLRFRGHQFRYSELIEGEPPSAYGMHVRQGGRVAAEGWTSRNVLGSYVHAHWASNPTAARGFVESCARFQASADSTEPGGT